MMIGCGSTASGITGNCSEFAGLNIMSQQLIEIIRRLLDSFEKPWALFKNGTCVIMPEPEGDPKEQAIDILREWGSVHVGGPAGDFNTLKLKGHPGWIETCHHPAIATYVDENEIKAEDSSDVAIGLLGRAKRQQDTDELEILHVEEQKES